MIKTNIHKTHSTGRIVCDGNSLGVGNGNPTAAWPFNLAPLLTSAGMKAPNITNICVGGQTTVDMTNRQSAFLYPNIISTSHLNIVVAMEVRNDLMSGTSDSDAYTNFRTYCQNAKNNGFYVIGVNHTPSTGGTPVGRTQAQMETSRQNVRAMFLADFNIPTSQSLIYLPSPGITYADLWCDVGGDSVMGDVASCANALLFTDGTHTTQTGSINIATIQNRAIAYFYSIHVI